MMKASTAIALASAIIATGTSALAAEYVAAASPREAHCRALAAEKYWAIRIFKRREFIKNCVAERPFAKKNSPETTGQK